VQNVLIQFAEAAKAAEHSEGGIAALGLNWQAFLFQLITFVIVLLVLRKFVFGKLTATIEGRRDAVEKSLTDAAKTADELKKSEQAIAALLAEARTEAEALVAAGHKEAVQMVEEAERKAAARAEHIVTEAKAQMDVEVAKAREALKTETATLVALATERIIREKLDPTKDAALIKAALSEAAKGRANA
jgi:F-type H+-transporting ATPase subunit b